MTTLGSEQEADVLATALVQRRLAACAQTLGPIHSHYRWQGAIEEAREWQCLLKTKADLFPQVEAAILELHPYEEPEILAVPILAGSPGYLAWVRENVG